MGRVHRFVVFRLILHRGRLYLRSSFFISRKRRLSRGDFFIIVSYMRWGPLRLSQMTTYLFKSLWYFIFKRYGEVTTSNVVREDLLRMSLKTFSQEIMRKYTFTIISHSPSLKETSSSKILHGRVMESLNANRLLPSDYFKSRSCNPNLTRIMMYIRSQIYTHFTMEVKISESVTLGVSSTLLWSRNPSIAL